MSDLSNTHSNNIPSSKVHPLFLLDQFLLSLPFPITNSTIKNEKKHGTDDTSDTVMPSRGTPTDNRSEDEFKTGGNHKYNSVMQKERQARVLSKEEKQQSILETADFLYGGADDDSSQSVLQSESILEEALSLLDNPKRISGIKCPVRLIRAKPSGRCILLVEGKEKDNSFSFKHTSSAIKHSENPSLTPMDHQSDRHFKRNTTKTKSKTYLCTLGNTMREYATMTFSNVNHKSRLIDHPLAVGRLGFHCTCSSFLKYSQTDRLALCSHLLAARLAPYLNSCWYVDDNDSQYDHNANDDTQMNGCHYYSEEDLEEYAFSRLVVSTMLG
mmetsp:Transcript_17968/g.25397  ORF Transcript_17968/g.25397 Transcript_17968/m.25397 type:complete len:328 (+) Transcript_17968:133-1116(+)